MSPPILLPRGDQLRMPSNGLLGRLSGSGMSQIFVAADVKAWLAIGVGDVSGLVAALDGKQPFSSALSNISEQSIEDFGLGVLSIVNAGDFLAYIGAASNASLATKADLVGGLVPASQLPSYVDDVLEFAALGNFPATGETGKIYVATGTGKTYRWGGSSYVELTASTAVWGSVSGLLSNQTDLQSALEAKASTSHSHSFASLTGVPTTLVGFGITDAQPLDADLTTLASEGIDRADDQTYSGTITWTGTTAPSGTATLRYHWYRVGKFVQFQFRFEWTTAGSTISAAQFPFPAGMPVPYTVTGQSNSEIVTPCQCLAGPASVGGITAANGTEARIQLDGSGNPEIRARFTNTNIGTLHVSGVYRCP